MSVSILPEWKQLLLERKRREELEREKREREEKERLASMPAWKRQIIQRRRAKQEDGGEKEREKVRDAERESEPETVSIDPTGKNSFISSQNGFTKEQQMKEMEKGNNEGKRQRESNYERMRGEEKEKYNQREDNRGKWRDREINRGKHMERTREREIIEGMKERDGDADRGRKVGERDYVIFPLVSAIHTIKAENIFIIENRKIQIEMIERDGERETEEGKKQEIRMDLKEFLGGGQKVTEICASEVLIIKPSMKEERIKEDRKQMNEDEKKMTLGVIEREGEVTECRRVSQLISKFGKNCKLPCRSKSSDCFIPVELGGEMRKGEKKGGDRKDGCGTRGIINAFRGGPKRSFSFSEQVCKERRVLERSYSDRRKREIEGGVVKEEKREEERNEIGNEAVNKTDRNSENSTFKGEMKRIREQNKQKRIMKKDKLSREAENEIEDIQRVRNDRKQQTEFQNESMKIVKHRQAVAPVPQSMVMFSGGEIESQSNREKQGMSVTLNEALHHRGEVLIPRSVFYGISDQTSRKDRDEIRRVERRLSWKAGRPLTRVESLRERIWQKERGGTKGGDEQAREAEMESSQEVASPQSLSQFDVTREVSKEELPVCVPPSLSVKRESSVLTEQHDGVIQAPEREKEREEDLLGEDYIPPSQSSSSFSSPSPPLAHTQPTMSRIYNQKPVTSRANVCITERNLDIQAHSGGVVTIRSGGQFTPGPPKKQTEISSLRSVQRKVEQLPLKEQEVRRQNDGEASQRQNACETCQDQNLDMQKSQTHTISKPSSEPRAQIHLPQVSTSTTKSINAQIEPTVKSSSTPLFTIRSASGGPGKRGTTITITPRKSVPSRTPVSSVTTPKVPSSSVTTPKESSSSVTTPKESSSSVTTPKAPSSKPELQKKRYPTAEEIEVIGGYQNLERSCLVKNRGSPKMVRVCFDDSQLECVCTYLSETSLLEEEGSSDDFRRTEEKKEENDEEEEDDDGVIGGGRGMKRVLRVDESCRR